MGRQVCGGRRTSGGRAGRGCGGASIITAELESGMVGQAYSQTLEAHGAPEPFEWEVTAGALPDDLSLDANTGEISGTPSAADTFAFTVQVTAANGATASKELTIVIDPGIG